MTGTPDLLLPVRAAMMSALKRSVEVTAIIPAASGYPSTVPANRTKPFWRFGTMLASPFRASGLDSSAFRISVQGFSSDIKNGAGTIIMPAEDAVIAIGSAFKVALDDATLTLSTGGKLRLAWIQSSPTRDGDEASAWMVTSTFRGEVSG